VVSGGGATRLLANADELHRDLVVELRLKFGLEIKDGRRYN